MFWQFKKNLYLCTRNRETNLGYEKQAEIAQLVEHNLAKVRVASSSLVFRSKTKEVSRNADFTFGKNLPDEVSIICSRPLLRRLFCLYIAPPRTCGKVLLYQLSKSKTGKQAIKATKLKAEQKQNINKDTNQKLGDLRLNLRLIYNLQKRPSQQLV